MPVGESINFDPSIPEFEAIIQNALPESLFKVSGKYMTSQVYDKTLTYKGKEYTPGPMAILYVNEDYINVVVAPGGFRFDVGGKTFQVGTDRKRIAIIAGGEPILWREAVGDPQSYDPVDSVGTPLQGDECRITNGLAQTPFSYFYMTGGVGGILQSIPLQDGTVFRQRKTGGVPGQQAYAWYRFSKTTDGGGIFREVDTVLDVYIATIKNIDFAKLGDLDALVDAMDTVDGKPFQAKFFRDTKYRIEMNILLNAQTDSRQNGVYYLSAVEGDNEGSTIARVSPLLKWTLGYIGRTKVTVWHGDRFGQDEAWLSSSDAIRPESKDPRVNFDTTPHVWIKSKPEIEIEERVYANLEKITKLEEEIEGVTGAVVAEADPVALAKLDEAKTALETSIAALPTDDELKALSDALSALDTAKADQADVDALNTAVEELNTAIAAGATQEELDAATKKVSDAVASAQASIAAVESTLTGLNPVVNWSNIGFAAGRIVARENSFFKCVIAHTVGTDPLTDKGGHWTQFPQDGNVIPSNRSPTVEDKYAEGTIWEDQSFGVTTPLRFITTGNGLWTPLNQITLSRVRFDIRGTNTSSYSAVGKVTLFKADGTEIPNSWLVWGKSSNLSGPPAAGSSYTAQAMKVPGNRYAWAELEPSSSFDTNVSISKITGAVTYAACNSITFYYSNGGSKTFTPSDGNFATCSPPIAARFGDSTISAQGETLTATKLTNPSSTDPGRVTGEAFVAAVNAILAAKEIKRETIRSTEDPDYSLEWETWRKITTNAAAWTITVTEYARTSEDSSMPMNVQTRAMRPPSHETARTNEQGEFVNDIPGGGEFVYTNSRNGGNNYATFPADVYKEVASYYVDVNDVPIPLTTMAQQVAVGSTALGIGAIAISTDAVAFVVDFYRLDNSKISYRVPLS